MLIYEDGEGAQGGKAHERSLFGWGGIVNGLFYDLVLIILL